ncbi:MAG: hypothetical protein M1824_002347 [Vezdaea acicularis]|nr:MAG: hypothetical protein M1824_002347 [Vezdaea acicularis]
MSHLDLNGIAKQPTSEPIHLSFETPTASGGGTAPSHASALAINGELSNGNATKAANGELGEGSQEDATQIENTLPAQQFSGSIVDATPTAFTQSSDPDAFAGGSVLSPFSTAPAVVEPQISNLRGESDPSPPVTSQTQIAESIDQPMVMEDKEQSNGQTTESAVTGSEAHLVEEPIISKEEKMEVADENMDEWEVIDEKDAGTLEVPSVQEAAPLSNDPIKAEEAVTDPATSAPAPLTVDTDMADAPVSSSKVARERSDEGSDDERAPKRTRTDDDGSAPPEFKVPDIPSASTPNSNAERIPSAFEAKDGSKSLTKAQNKYLSMAVRNLKRTKDAPAFANPVDPVKLNIPTYPDIVKNPMDLSTMEQKLKNDQYSSVDDVVADIDLIVENAKKFNGPDHAVSQSAVNLRASFEKALPNVPKDDVVELSAAEKKAKKMAQAAPKTTAARRQSRSAATAGSPTDGQRFALVSAGVPLIRRDSTANDGRPKREIKPSQPRDLPYTSTKPKKKKYQWELKFCQMVIDEMNKQKHFPYGSPFYNPVDPVALNIPTYFQVIKKPMDLSHIQRKLREGQYENAKEFEADVRLMFNNCYKFNPPSDGVYQLGKRFEEVFNKKWETKKEWLDSHVPPSAPPSAATTPEPEEEEADSEEEEDEEQAIQGKNLQLQIELMQKQLELLQQAASSKTSPPPGKRGGKAGKMAKKSSKKVSTVPTSALTGRTEKKKRPAKKEQQPAYVTFEQKQEISNRINSLPQDRMSEALNIIKQSMPNLNNPDDEEMELDIDELSQDTLRKLLSFVQKYTPGATHSNKSASRPKASRMESDHVPRAKKKNKPMSKTEQDARISELEGKLKNYQNPGSPSDQDPRNADDGESSGDDPETGSESEED